MRGRPAAEGPVFAAKGGLFCDFHRLFHMEGFPKGAFPMEAREKAEKFEKNAKFCLTKKAECSILTWCVNAHNAMKREIADAVR